MCGMPCAVRRTVTREGDAAGASAGSVRPTSTNTATSAVGTRTLDMRARRLRLLRALALRWNLDDVPGELHGAHRADDPGRRVDLVPAHAVMRRARERVVVV